MEDTAHTTRLGSVLLAEPTRAGTGGGFAGFLTIGGLSRNVGLQSRSVARAEKKAHTRLPAKHAMAFSLLLLYTCVAMEWASRDVVQLVLTFLSAGARGLG